MQFQKTHKTKIPVLMKSAERKYIYTHVQSRNIWGQRPFITLRALLSTKIITVIININQINVIM